MYEIAAVSSMSFDNPDFMGVTNSSRASQTRRPVVSGPRWQTFLTSPIIFDNYAQEGNYKRIRVHVKESEWPSVGRSWPISPKQVPPRFPSHGHSTYFRLGKCYGKQLEDRTN